MKQLGHPQTRTATTALNTPAMTALSIKPLGLALHLMEPSPIFTMLRHSDGAEQTFSEASDSPRVRRDFLTHHSSRRLLARLSFGVKRLSYDRRMLPELRFVSPC
jgi:hypothetical protein